MKETFYHNLKENFAKIKFLFSANLLDYNKIDAVVGELKFSAKQIEKHGSKNDRKIQLYCINTLFEVIEEGDREKIYSFADLIHNMPDIFLGKRNFYSFRKEINCFNEKYPEDLFTDMNKIFPFFSTQAPKNAFEFFSPKSDKDFKSQHPIGYWILVILGVVAFILPLLILPLLFYIIFDGTQGAGGWPLLAIVGCLVMGVGLFNIVAAFIHQYLGRLIWLFVLLVVYHL